jgi:hypothetical protein
MPSGAVHPIIPAKRSTSRDPYGRATTLMDRMGPGPAPLRGLAGMTVEGNYYAAANADMS